MRPVTSKLAVAALAIVSVAAVTPAWSACRFNTTIIVEGPSKARLPAESQLSLTIFDGNLADAPMSMTAVATVEKRVSGQRFPLRIPVSVRSDKKCPVWPSLSARIDQRGKLAFLNDTQTRVHKGKRTTVKLIAVSR